MSRPTDTYSSTAAIRLIAAREARAVLTRKSVWVTLAIMLVAVLGGLGWGAWQGSKENAPQVIGYVGAEPAALAAVTGDNGDGPAMESAGYPDRDTALAALSDGDIDAIYRPAESGTGWELVSESSVDTDSLTALRAAQAAIARDGLLTEFGISGEQVAEITAAGTVTTVRVDGGSDGGAFGDPRTAGTVMVTLIGLGVLVMSVMMFAITIGSAVIEEKSSRVVELMVATVRPLDLLWGKIIGVGGVGLAFVATLFAVTAAGIGFTGIGERFDVEIDLTVLPVLLLFYVLGYLFFSVLYAAAGSLVSRMEDFQGVQTPVILLLMAVMYVPFFGLTQVDSTFMRVVAWVPPFSSSTIPLQYAVGNVGVGGVLGAALILTLATVATSWLAARIYRSSILHTGSPVGWLKALRGVRRG
ncbi:ABC transporter permease [Corynebacterium antarcticum]|uniref:ABC transporter permease n=1 Tax=Corynebacterium antarcticum TaxID=2800405 RepID=UPI002005F0F8|nr:ABC transporter permease [Corynebacterium antarcticum]MCK7642746.1 ABC transporter permease [Corynebacterium antarcticum]MCK7661232.1 ABC transporter permease [Corynebacterium antarcticum]MCX7492233.1 ABC transporter permease [Corynebacterium antarcticum]MCX7540557.1 ABC transporter permease [Corynebacterium antarcticum]